MHLFQKEGHENSILAQKVLNIRKKQGRSTLMGVKIDTIKAFDKWNEI